MLSLKDLAWSRYLSIAFCVSSYCSCLLSNEFLIELRSSCESCLDSLFDALFLAVWIDPSIFLSNKPNTNAWPLKTLLHRMYCLWLLNILTWESLFLGKESPVPSSPFLLFPQPCRFSYWSVTWPNSYPIVSLLKWRFDLFCSFSSFWISY